MSDPASGVTEARDGATVILTISQPARRNALSMAIREGLTDALDRIESDDMPWETSPLESLARDDELRAFRHAGFWQPMDTLRDKTMLESLWSTGNAPWKVWKD